VGKNGAVLASLVSSRVHSPCGRRISFMCDHLYPQMEGVFSGVLFWPRPFLSIGGVLFYEWPRFFLRWTASYSQWAAYSSMRGRVFFSGGRRFLPRMSIPRAAQKKASPYPEQRNAPPRRPPEKRRLTSKTGSHTTIHHTVVNGIYIYAA